jgi:hypothetical protein
MKSVATQFWPYFWKKREKTTKKQQKPKKYVFDVFVSFAASFLRVQLLMCFLKSTLKLIFKKKIKIYKGTKCEKKEVKGPNYFWVAWSPSKVCHQAIENNLVFYL